MSQRGSTLLCTSRTGDLPCWTDTSRYDFLVTTKDCKAAAAVSHPGPHHNSNIVSAKQLNRGCVMNLELVDAGPRCPSPNTSASCILDTMSRPQHHPDGLLTPRKHERLMHPLPQRPIPHRHKSLADPMEMKRREVCRNFLAKRCTRGDACHRQHILEGDEIRNVSTSIAPNPEHVVQSATPILPPPPNFTTTVDSPTIPSSIRIVDGLYIDRFSRQRALRLDGPSTALPSLSLIDRQSEEQLHRQSNHAHRVAPLSQTLQHEAQRCDSTPTPIYQSSLQSAPSYQQLPPPSSTMPPPSAMDAGTASPSSAHCPARVAEQDTRPARKFDEVCRLYQTGQCLYGERCFRTHTLALPIQVAAITSSSSTEKVKKPAPPLLSTHTGGVELCKLNLAGKCPRRDGCHYSHDVELPIRPQSRPPSPGPSQTMEDLAASSQCAGPTIEKLPSPPPTGELPVAAAHPPASEPPQKAYVTLPGHVCRMYFFTRHCAWPSCRFRHCSPEETQAFREASLTTVHSKAQHEVPAAVELPAPIEQDDPAPSVISGEHENKHLQPSESASDGSVQEGSPRSSSTSKKRIKSRKKKGIGKDLVDETGHDVGKDKAVIAKGKLKVSEEVRTPKDKGKTGPKAKSIVVNASEKVKGATTNANEKSSVKDKKITTNDQGVDEGGTTSSETGAPGVNVKHEKGKGKTTKHKVKDEKSKDKDGRGKDKDEKGKDKGKGKEKETGRWAKGRSSAEIVSPSPELSAPLSPPSPAGSSSADSSRSAVQSSTVDSLQSTQRTPVAHAKVAATSNCVTGARMMALPDDGGDTDVEESGSSYYTPGSGTISTQSSWSSVNNSSVSTVRIGYCFDFVRGECKRRHCRFSHDVPSLRLPNHPNSRPVHHGSSDASANANVEHNQEVPSVSRSVVGPTPGRAIRMQQDPVQDPRPLASRIMPSSTGPVRQASEGSFSEPLVPPGLGLDTVDVANAGQSQEGDAADEAVTITVLDSIKVTFSSGFRIVQVNTGFESRQILLEKLPPTVVPADLKLALCRFGDITTIHAVESGQDHSSAYRVSFSRAESAIDAVEALNGSELFGSTVTAQIAAKKSTGIGGGTLHDGDVLFELPTARQKGYVGYETLEKAQKAIALATQKGMKGMRVTATIYEGIPVVGNVNVRFENLPADATAKDLGRYGAFETHMVDRPKYHWTVNVAVDGLRRMLETHGEVSLNVLPPPYGKVFRVWAHFKDPQAAASAHGALNRFCPRFVGKQRIFAHHVRSIRYNLPADIYDILAHDINLLRSYHYDEHATSISVFDRRVGAPGAPVLVKLVSRNMTSLTKLKTAFDRLLRGEKVTDKGQIVWNDFFGGRTGKEFLDELEKVHPAVKINRDFHRRTLALFGPQQDRAAVRAEIITRAKLLEAQRKHRYTITGNLIGVFMSEDLVILQKDLGHGNVWIDLTHGQLVVCGDANTQKVARLAVQHAGKRCKKRNARGEVGCPVCLGEVSQPVTLACGHTWCRGCLTGYMNASVNNKTFPLTCLGDDAKCSHHIPLSIARQFLSPDEFDAVVNAAFLAHVQSRPSEFQYCPTPDCPQVYRKSGHRGTVLQCPSCLVRICAHCNMEYHESRSCQDRNPEDEKLFETWKMGRDVKDCPSCKVPIERMAGCNHMTCMGCHTHICWACLATFETSGEVYGHMRAIHGGIGL